MKCFIGIDIGTSTICGTLNDLSNKRTEVLTRTNDATLTTSILHERIQEPGRIFEIVEEILKFFIFKYPGIQGIGFTGQMHGILYIDKNGNNLSPLINWQDGRGNLPFRKDLNYASYLSHETGYKVASGFGLVTHFYNLKNNLVPKGAWKICTIMDYVILRLCRISIPVIDNTNAASLGFFDLEKLQFDTDAIERLSINRDILPDISCSYDPVGEYRDIPIYPAIGDNQAGFLGSVNFPDNSVLVNIGTSGQISVYSEKCVNSDIIDTRPFPGGGYIVVGATLCGGNSLSLLKHFFEESIKLFSDSSSSCKDFYEIANSLVLTQNDELLVETLFEGTRLDTGKKGSISKITINNFTPPNLITGFYKGVCNELFEFYKKLPSELKKDKLNLIGSGNAIRRNILLCKALEQVFNTSLIIPRFNEEAAFGACILAMVGSKSIDSFINAGKLVEYISHQDFVAI